MSTASASSPRFRVGFLKEPAGPCEGPPWCICKTSRARISNRHGKVLVDAFRGGCICVLHPGLSPDLVDLALQVDGSTFDGYDVISRCPTGESIHRCCRC